MPRSQVQQGPKTVPPVLRRNQACHQCRKRKLKCDAQRPCATCKKSHANALMNAPPGTSLPPQPECTYDELPDKNFELPSEKPPVPSAGGGIHNKFTNLQDRIDQLERELAKKEEITRVQAARLKIQMTQPTSSLESAASAFGSSNPLIGMSSLQMHTPHNQPSYVSPTGQYSSPDTLLPQHGPYPTPFTPINVAAGPSSLPFGQSMSMPGMQTTFTPTFSDFHADGMDPPMSTTPMPTMNGGQDPTDMYSTLMFSNWPPRLPRLELLRHLVQTFFASHPHAPRLLHQPTFMSSLDLAPNHPNFPALSLLHAICALASIWSPLVEQQDPALQPPDTEDGTQPSERKGHWFGEMHAKFSREEEERGATGGVGVFQGLQSIVVLTWYYYAHARWVEVWLYTAKAMRYSVPMGLNVTNTHGPLLRSWTMPSILGPPRDHIEEEMRRNTFWLAYCIERWQAASTGWAMALDDEDISQVLSCRMSDFESGLKVSADWRQRISTPRMLTLHMPDQTDAFTLYIKGTILFSKVKNFNSRFKNKYYYAVAGVSASSERFIVGPGPRRPLSRDYSNDYPSRSHTGSGGPSPDPSPLATLTSGGVLSSDDATTGARLHQSPTSYAMGQFASPVTPGPPGPERIDPRDTPSFKAIDGLIESFKTSFPKDLRDPLRGGRVDPALYVACLVPYVATILLHDPHADPSSPFCKSSEKLLTAGRKILDLAFILCSTSFDVTLMDPVASFAWFIAARVLVRFLKAALEARNHTEALSLRNEVEFLRLALRKVGERIPLGFRQAKMVEDLLSNEIGNTLDDRAFMASMSQLGSVSPGVVPGQDELTTPSPILSHRGSLSAQGQPMPNLAPRGSFSMPSGTPSMRPRGSLSAQGGLGPPTSLSANGGPSPRGSFSAQGQPMQINGGGTGLPLPSPHIQASSRRSFSMQGQANENSITNSPLGQGNMGPPPLPARKTKGVSVSELLKMNMGGLPANGFGAAEVHINFLEGLAGPDERDDKSYVIKPQLEMMLPEMIEDAGVGGENAEGETDPFASLVGFSTLGSGSIAPQTNGGIMVSAGGPESMFGGVGLGNW